MDAKTGSVEEVSSMGRGSERVVEERVVREKMGEAAGFVVEGRECGRWCGEE